MTETGLLERVEDDIDRRRAFIALTDKAAEAMARYFTELGRDGARLAVICSRPALSTISPFG